jgi:tRNA pseudouridine55 synthase
MARVNDGLLIVDKPSGPTSHDVVRTVRRRFGTRLVGHAGTLDPMASGVLLVMIGQATKLSPYLMLDNKRYRARVEFGMATDTWDRLGTTTERVTLARGTITQGAVAAALAGEMSRTEQTPPTFSAIKVAGRAAHRRRRAGEAVVLEPRNVRVHAATLLSFDETSASFDLLVSKGYYVRSFARDLGVRLRLPAHLSALERLASGTFSIHEAVSWPSGDIPPLLSLEAAAARTIGTAVLTERGTERARCGKVVEAEDFLQGPPARDPTGWLGATDGQLVAVGFRHSDNCYRVLRGFRPRG